MHCNLKTGFLSLFACSLFLVSCGNNQQSTTEAGGIQLPNILPADTVSGTRNEQTTIRTTFDGAVAELRANADNPKPLLDLAAAYVLEGRLSGNGGYYSNAALKVLNKVIDGETSTPDQRFQAYSLKSAVLLNMHQFKDALTAAQEGLKIADFNAGIWGAITDANVELGNYAEAVKAADKMISIRPDLRSYSRVSYLRQIYGDNRGAIDAMKMAVESGVPGLESTEWARVQLGDLYLGNGQVDSARLIYRYSLVYRPGYPFAEMGMARADKAQGNYDGAISHARTAIKALSEPAFISFLADAYALKGDAAKAKEIRTDVVRLMEEAAENEPKDAIVRHNSARELSQAHLAAGDLDKAQRYARQDYEMRPDNIDANELMGWICFLRGEKAKALEYAAKSLKTGVKNAATLYKAGLIYAANGDGTKGTALQAEALAINPHIDPAIIAAGK